MIPKPGVLISWLKISKAGPITAVKVEICGENVLGVFSALELILNLPKDWWSEWKKQEPLLYRVVCLEVNSDEICSQGSEEPYAFVEVMISLRKNTIIDDLNKSEEARLREDAFNLLFKTLDRATSQMEEKPLDES